MQIAHSIPSVFRIPTTMSMPEHNDRTTGFATGTMILTPEGERPVESLMAGDLLQADGGMTCALRGMSVHRLRHARVVSVAPGAISLDWAREDLIVGADQCLMLANWRTRDLPGGKALVPARKLTSELGISLIETDSICLYQLHCDSPRVIRAGGIEAGTTPLTPPAGRAPTLH